MHNNEIRKDKVYIRFYEIDSFANLSVSTRVQVVRKEFTIARYIAHCCNISITNLILTYLDHYW